MPDTAQPQVMISYARKDAKDFAGRLASELRHHGIIAWLDTSDIEGGAEWLQSLEQGISTCKVVIAVRTPGGRESMWVRRERLYALEKRKPIIPVLQIACETDLELIDRQPVDFTHSFEMALPKLVERVRELSNGHVPEPIDRRTLELAYLGRILLEHSIWQDLYTPMAGVAHMLQEDTTPDAPAIQTVATPIDTLFGAYLDEVEQAECHTHEQLTRQQQYTDILPAVEDLRQLVVLGDPGCGKTTTLWRIAADYAERAKANPIAPLPVFVRLGQIKSDESLEAHLTAQLGELGPHYHALLSGKRLALLLDGLNELPKENRVAQARDIKALVERCQHDGMVAVVTCRALDFVGDLRLDIPQRVTIEPLDPIRIRTFVHHYIKHPPDAGDTLFWQLAGDHARKYWQWFQRDVGDDPALFWLAHDLPEGAKSGFVWTWDRWLKERAHPRSMLTLAQTPYMLYMMTQVFTRHGEIPPNRGRLFQQFVDFLLLKREKMEETVAEDLKVRLAELAYTMQAKGEAGTSASRAEVLAALGSEERVYQAQSANILGGTDEIRFTHQLLQEFFAAHKLDREMRSGILAERFWPPENWWKPTGWEETAILLTGLYNDDCTPVIEWLRDANPELAARCVQEGGAHTPDETIQALQPRWIPRLTDLRHDPQPSARAAVGRAASMLKLDSRPGILAPNGVPQFAWCEVLSGPFRMGGDPDAANKWDGAEFNLPYTFWIAQYPVTYAQYEPFVAANGYANDAYWTPDGLKWRGDKRQPDYAWNDAQWHIANHPVVGVTWYEAYAYTRWLNALIPRPLLPQGEGEYMIRLARECEWEKAARYPDGRLWPWGNEWDNGIRVNWDGSKIGRTSAVGIFPNGANPAHGASDLIGNVWEWCLTQWASGYQSPDTENNDPNGPAGRCLRGGSCDFDFQYDLRAAARGGDGPSSRGSGGGFRVVVSVPI